MRSLSLIGGASAVFIGGVVLGRWMPGTKELGRAEINHAPSQVIPQNRETAAGRAADHEGPSAAAPASQRGSLQSPQSVPLLIVQPRTQGPAPATGSVVQSSPGKNQASNATAASAPVSSSSPAAQSVGTSSFSPGDAAWVPSVSAATPVASGPVVSQQAGKSAPPHAFPQPATLNSSLHEDAPGNSFVAEGHRVEVEGVDEYEDGSSDLIVSATPEPAAPPDPRAAGFTYEQALFRTKWGWDAYNQAVQAAKDGNRRNP